MSVGVGAGHLSRDQHVDRVHRLDEAGDAGNVIDANRGGTHAVRQQIGDGGAKALACQLRREDRLIDGHRTQDDAPLARGRELVEIRKGAGRNAGRRIVDELHLVRRDVDPVIQRDRGDSDLGGALLGLLDQLIASADIRVREIDREEPQNDRHCQCDHRLPSHLAPPPIWYWWIVPPLESGR